MLLKHTTIHDGLGRVFVGDVAVERGTILAVGPDLPGEGEDLTDLHLFPGFIDPHTKWGVNGRGTEIKPSSNDNDECSDPVTPELNTVYAVNGRAMSLQQLSAFGITAVGVAPSDNNIFGGTVGAFTTCGVNPFAMCLKENAAMKASVAWELKRVYGKAGKAPMTRMRIFQMFTSMLQKTRTYDAAGEKRDPKLEALQPVLEGKLPLFVSADSAEERKLIMDILATYPSIKVIFTSMAGMDETDLALTPERVSFIDTFAGMDCDPRCIGRRYDVLRKLMDRGMDVAVSSAGSGREWMLWEGMELCKVLGDEERTIRAMTYIGAKLLGIAEKTGSIEPGKRADFAIWSAHPLTDFRAKVLRTYIGGECVYREGDAMRCYI